VSADRGLLNKVDLEFFLIDVRVIELVGFECVVTGELDLEEPGVNINTGGGQPGNVTCLADMDPGRGRERAEPGILNHV
jgi:hypothetical protein